MICIFTVYDSGNEVAAEIILNIKNGDRQLREKFIKDYIPFILKVISNTFPGKRNLKDSDEFSIGLIAFNEAIDKYNREKSNNSFNFFSFAEQVIKRRLIDYIRSVSRQNQELPFSSFNNSEQNYEENHIQEHHTTNNFSRIELFEEIKCFEKQLDTFGLKISDLHKYTPKHRDSREMCVDIGKKIASNNNIYRKLITKKYFPMKELTQIVNVNPRTIERNREYIISVALIYGNKYDHLQSYLGDSNHRRKINVP